jgi:hypothetical protein
MKMNYERQKSQAEQDRQTALITGLSGLAKNQDAAPEVRNTAQQMALQVGMGVLIGQGGQGQSGKSAGIAGTLAGTPGLTGTGKSGGSGSGGGGKGKSGKDDLQWLSHGILSALSGAGRQAESVAGIGANRPSGKEQQQGQAIQQALQSAGQQPRPGEPGTAGELPSNIPGEAGRVLGPQRVQGPSGPQRAGMFLNQAEQDERAQKQAAFKSEMETRAAVQQQTARLELEAKQARAAENLKRQDTEDYWTEHFKKEGKTGQDLINAVDAQIAKEQPPQSGSTEKVEFTAPNGESISLYRSPGTRKLYDTLTGAEVSGLDLLSKGYKPKEPAAPSGEKGTLEQSREAHEIADNPSKHSPAEVEAAQAFIKNEKLGMQSRAERNVVELMGIPGQGGPVAPAVAGQRPIDRLNPKQKQSVQTAINVMAGVVTAGIGGNILRFQANDGINTISEITGLPVEELNARGERRKADRQAYDLVNTQLAGYQAFSNDLDRYGRVLTGLRDRLPDSEVKVLNKWLFSGATNFDVKGLSDTATQYGLALAAVRNGYARIIGGATLSRAGTSPEALRDASLLISNGLTKKNAQATIDQIRTEAQQTVGGRRDEARDLLKNISQPLVPELYGNQYQEIPVTPVTPIAGRQGQGPAEPQIRIISVK